MKSAGKARNNGLYRHIRTSKEIIRNLLNDWLKKNSRFRLNKEKQLPFSKICCHMEIQPRVLATELIRMIAAKTGQR